MRVATVLSLLPDAIDPPVRALLRVFIGAEPADVVPCVEFMLDEEFMLEEFVPVAPVPRDVVPGPLSPDCAEPPVPLVPLADEPDVPPLVAPELPEPDPVEPELAPVPALPELPPVCACARPISATAAIVAIEVRILVDM